MRIFKQKNKEESESAAPARLSWGWIGIYVFAAVSLLIYVIAIFSEDFANFFTRYPSAFVRGLLSYLTYIIPISLAELMLILLIPAAVAVIIVACKRYCETWRSVLIFGGKLLAVVCVLFSLFVWTLGPGYRTAKLEDRLGFADAKIEKESLERTAKILIDEINLAVKEVEFGEDGFSPMPYSLDEMSKRLMVAYDEICDDFDFIPRLYSRVKPVMLSEPMTYTHIAGVYSYFTGEANINVVFPDFTLPFTAAHELAHQRGISREDEANFIAFMVCARSNDPYIRYSGYVGVLDYVLDAYYSADRSEGHADYKALYATLDERVRREQRAYYDFYQKYAHNIAADVSGAVNNSYLQSQGTPGTVSYGLVADLTVRYYASQSAE